MNLDIKSNLECLRITTLEKKDFDLEKTLLCGQCFRWSKMEDYFVGILKQTLLVIHETPVCYQVEIYGEDISDDFLFDYFDLNRDYAKVLKVLSKLDVHMSRAVSYGNGIRILKQDLFETLISFIISSNNNIPKIKMSIEALSERFGTCIGSYKGQLYYAFPNVEVLARASEAELGVKAIGYRAKSVYLTSHTLFEKKIDLETPFLMPYLESREWLKQFYGVGDKVADCVLLFAYAKQEAFPIDTWVKKMLGELYGIEKEFEKFIRTYFKEYPGIAQQYLFYYIRNQKS